MVSGYGPLEGVPADRRESVAEAVAAAALEALQWNWGDAYAIEFAEGVWEARRRDGLGGPLESGNPEGLSAAIRDDYKLRPVRRD